MQSLREAVWDQVPEDAVPERFAGSSKYTLPKMIRLE